jgi:Cu-Zn family superoxide dismutase
MKSASGRALGSLNITDVAQALSLDGTLRGLPPGTHGVNLHMVGRCDAPAFKSAGGHWCPTSKLHGTENAQGPHLGDLNILTVGADSSASILVVTRSGSLRGTNMLMDTDGAALVVHTSADDYRTDPSGNSGARIACGVISGNR